MSFTGKSDDPRKVQGQGTAYPVGSEKHEEQPYERPERPRWPPLPEQDVPDNVSVVDGTPEPVFHELGPVDVPKPTSTVVVAAVFTSEHIAGLVNRTLAIDPKYAGVLRSIDGRKFRKVRIDMADPGPGWLFTVEYEL